MKNEKVKGIGVESINDIAAIADCNLDNAECDIVGVGNARIRMHDVIVWTLIGVRHILKLKKNLISFSVDINLGVVIFQKLVFKKLFEVHW